MTSRLKTRKQSWQPAKVKVLRLTQRFCYDIYQSSGLSHAVELNEWMNELRHSRRCTYTCNVCVHVGEFLGVKIGAHTRCSRGKGTIIDTSAKESNRTPRDTVEIYVRWTSRNRRGKKKKERGKESGKTVARRLYLRRMLTNTFERCQTHLCVCLCKTDTAGAELFCNKRRGPLRVRSRWNRPVSALSECNEHSRRSKSVRLF